MEGIFVGKCRMEPDLVIWKGTGSESTIGCERGASYGFPWGIYNYLKLDPESGMWKGLWFGKVKWAQAR